MEINKENNFSEKRKKEIKLVKRAQLGDEEAYTLLFEMYYKTVYFIVYKFVHNNDDAADLTLEAFTKAFNNINLYVPSSAFITWLTKIAVNHTIDFLRKQKSNQTYSLDQTHPQIEDNNSTLKNIIETEDIDPEEKYIKREKIKLLEKLINELPADYSKILSMKYFKGLSYKEISKKLSLPLGTVKARIHRGKELLASLLKNRKDMFR